MSSAEHLMMMMVVLYISKVKIEYPKKKKYFKSHTKRFDTVEGGGNA